jgi:hypothetical protein
MENLHNIIESKIKAVLELSGHKFLNVDNDEDMQYIKDFHMDLYKSILYYRKNRKYIVLLFTTDETTPITLMWKSMEHMLFDIGRHPGENYNIRFSLSYLKCKFGNKIDFNDKMDTLICVDGNSLKEVIIKMDSMGI